MTFLALFIRLPTRASTGRMRVWRTLRALGCATLRDGVYLLPESDGNAVALAQVADEVRRAGGSADLFLLAERDGIAQPRLAALFDRGAEYARLLAAIAVATADDGKALRGLRRSFLALAAIDFFPGEARRQTEAALAALEAAATGEPAAIAGRVRRLVGADFRGRTWATRKHLWVDRMASAWLILRFIDPEARFVWLATPKRRPKGAVGFDFDGAAFTHVGGRVTFEVLAASFGLDGDPALARIGAIVHCLDVGGVPVAEAAGVEAVLAGLRAAAPDDDALVVESSRIFDGLYFHYQRDAGDG